ncbi:MAG: hypothetical protein ACKVU0_12975 [Saprospiraceae bacterium]
MNKLVFPLLLGLLITACQDTPKTEPSSFSAAPEATPPPAPAKVTPESVTEVSEKLAAAVKMMEGLRKQVDALPAKVKKEKSAEIEIMQATLEGMIEKQTGMLNELKTSTTTTSSSNDIQGSGGTAGPSAAQMQDYIESVARYAQEAQNIKEAVQKMGKN